MQFAPKTQAQMHRSSFCRRCWPNSIGSSWSSRLPTLLKYLRWLIRLTRLATFAMDITRVISCWSSQSYCLMLSWQVTRLTKELCHCSYLRSDCPQNESREDSRGSWNACHHLLTRCLADSSPEMLNFNISIKFKENYRLKCNSILTLNCCTMFEMLW